MIGDEIILESAARELAKKLPSLAKHDYAAIDNLMRDIAKKHHITGKAVHDLFVKQYNKTPDSWIKGKLDEEEDAVDLDKEVKKFAEWAAKRLGLKTRPVIELSYDTQDASANHHTGSHVEGQNSVWVYAKNRNLVDILRTIFHELTHVRQGELGMIKPGSSYPGSPIEVLADAMAGKYIKIYGEKNHHIFQ